MKQTDAELRGHLDEQIQFLKASADAFDRGFDGEAKRLALALRVLVHDKGKSRSLMGQLGLLSQAFGSTAIPHDPRNISSHAGLVMIASGGPGTRYVAMLDGAIKVRSIPFAEWWHEIVFVDDRRATLSRKDLVLSVVDQDGGAHVDPEINETYGRLSRENSLGWVSVGPHPPRAIRPPERASVRQIAHEVLKVLVPGYAKQSTEQAGLFVGGAMVYDGIPPEFTKTGRNELCPCGSGKKFKKCHGAPTA